MYIMGNSPNPQLSCTSRGSDINDHPVVSGLDARRKVAPERLVIELHVHVSEDRALRLHTRNPIQRLRKMSMGRMRCPAIAIDDPGPDALERGEGRFVQSNHVGRVREVAKPEAKGRAETVV